MHPEEALAPRSSVATKVWWAQGVGLGALLVLAALLVHVPALRTEPWNSDEAYLATEAQVLMRGGALYVDSVDRKPPIVPFIYAAGFSVTGGSDGLLTVRLFAIAASALAAWLLALEAQRRVGDARAGPIAGLLFLGSSAAFFPKDVQTANFEVFMLPAVIGAVMLAGRGRPLASGLLLGVGALVKQTALLTLLPLAWLAWHGGARGAEDRPPSELPSRIRSLAVLGLGCAAPILIAALGFGWHDFVYWVFTGNDSYLDVSGALGFTARLGLLQTGLFLVAHVAVIVLAAFAWPRRRENADLWLWVVSGSVAVLSGLRFFGHYYLEVLPPLCLLACRPLLGASRRVVVGAAVLIAVSVACFALPTFDPTRSRTQQISVDLAAYARAHTARDDRILVWGHLPEVYWRSDRRPATRFGTTGFLTGQSGGRPPSRAGMEYAAPGAWADFDADLHTHPPALVFDLAPADIRNARYAPPADFPRFGRYLQRSYRRVATVDRVTIYAPR